MTFETLSPEQSAILELEARIHALDRIIRAQAVLIEKHGLRLDCLEQANITRRRATGGVGGYRGLP